MKNYDLRELAELAEIAEASPQFTAKSGKTKAGRGLPKIPDLFEAKGAFCSPCFRIMAALS